ncbi:MAG: DUF5320 domain-containing protein [Elusimicrobiota bacterium]
MPGFDGTGPVGIGPMTGRAAGYCTGEEGKNSGPYGLVRGFFGRGMRMGSFGGCGRRNWYYATGRPGWCRAALGMPAWGGAPYSGPAEMAPGQEAGALKKESDYLKKELEAIQERIKTLEKGSAVK